MLILTIVASCANSPTHEIGTVVHNTQLSTESGTAEPTSVRVPEGGKRDSGPRQGPTHVQSCQLISLAHVGAEDKPLPIVVAHAESCARWARYEVGRVSPSSHGLPKYVPLAARELVQLCVILDDHAVLHRENAVPEVRRQPEGTFVVARSSPGLLAVGNLGHDQSCGVFEEIEH